MAHVTDDRIMETTTTTGTGALTLAGAVAGFRAFSAKMTSPSDTCFYMIEAVDVNGIPTGDFETGLGTYSGASTLTRTTVSRSSNADAIVTLVAGTKRVAIVDIAATCFTMTTAPIVPIVGQVNVGTRVLANASLLAMRSAQGIERLVQPQLGRTRVQTRQGAAGANGLLAMGLNGYSTAPTSSNQSKTPTNTNMLTRSNRQGFSSSAVAGSFAGFYAYGPCVTIGDGAGMGGFTFSITFGPSDTVTVAGARTFVGLSVSNAVPTNVNPASLTNVIGIGQVDGSTNLNIVFGGSTAQTPIDLGVNFPANTLSVDLYTLILFSDPFDNTKVGYTVSRYTTSSAPAFEVSGSLANTTPGTTLPASSSMMGDRLWRCNNATATACWIDFDRCVYIFD